MHELTKISRIPGRKSPSIKRSEQDGTMDTVSSETACVRYSPDTTNNSVIRNSDYHTNDNISNLRMRPCSVQLHDILDFIDTEQHCLILNVEPKTARPAIF